MLLVRADEGDGIRLQPHTSFAAVHESGFDVVDGSTTRHVSAMDVGAVKAPTPTMQTVTTNGHDIAKSVFQVHGVDAAGQVVIRR
jgi:hypothetical protein